MSRAGSRRWKVLCLAGIALWVGATVLAAVLSDDPSDPRPVLLTFAAGGAIFFGLIFAIAFLQTRAEPDPELDALLAELAVEPELGRHRASQIGAVRRVARAYILLGALVTGLGLVAIAQDALGLGSSPATLIAIVVIVVLWALAVPFVLRLATRASGSVLSPLGLEQRGSVIAGERHGRAVSIEVSAAGSVTRLRDAGPAPALRGEEILAQAGRGDAEAWRDVEVGSDGEAIVVRRSGHRGNGWLWDLWLAEHLAARP